MEHFIYNILEDSPFEYRDNYIDITLSVFSNTWFTLFSNSWFNTSISIFQPPYSNRFHLSRLISYTKLGELVQTPIMLTNFYWSFSTTQLCRFSRLQIQKISVGAACSAEYCASRINFIIKYKLYKGSGILWKSLFRFANLFSCKNPQIFIDVICNLHSSVYLYTSFINFKFISHEIYEFEEIINN